jgi:hypothetical protein
MTKAGLVLVACAACGSNRASSDAAAHDTSAVADAPIDGPDFDGSTWVVLSENTSSVVAAGDSYECTSNGQNVASNAWYRAFSVAQPFHISYVVFATEIAQNATVKVTISTYTGATGGTYLDTTMMTQVATNSAAGFNNSPAQLVDWPIAADVPAGDFVVEVSGANYNGSSFLLGANASGESAPSYFAGSVSGMGGTCDVPTPETVDGHDFIILVAGMY